MHGDDPAEYGDPNHKPEMAIALTPFSRRIEEISGTVEFAA